MKPVQKILVFRLSSIGDIVLTTALVRCLRNTYPNAQIDFVVKRQFASLMPSMPYINTVHQFDSSLGLKGLLQFRKLLRKQKYDVVLDIHKNWRSYFLCNTIGAKTYSFKKHVIKRYLMIRFKLDAYHIVRPVFLRFIDAAKEIGVKYDNKKTECIVPDQIQKGVDNYLEDNGIKPHKTFVVVCPGASFTNKQWQNEKFEQLTDLLVKKENLQVILLGGQKEQKVCKEIAKKYSHSVLSVAGIFDLSQSAALLNRAQVTIANDTGMLHLSEALNVPVVGIYGPTVRQFGYFPILEQSIVAQVELDCRPCTKMGMNSCPKGTFACTEQISVNQVYHNVVSILKKK